MEPTVPLTVQKRLVSASNLSSQTTSGEHLMGTFKQKFSKRDQQVFLYPFTTDHKLSLVQTPDKNTAVSSKVISIRGHTP